MIQRTFEIIEPNSLEGVLSSIAQMDEYKRASDRLLYVYEPICDPDFLERERDTIAAKLPESKIVGMTTLGPLSSATKVQEHTVLSVLLFEKTTVTLLEGDSNKHDQLELGVLFSNKIQALPNVKGIFCTSSNSRLCPDTLINILTTKNENLTIFGAQAGTRTVVNDESTFYTNNGIYRNGILIIAFCGKELEIKVDYNMGWKALGGEHTITGNNGCLVTSIDDAPSFDLYKKYLNIFIDKNFYANTCAFPLLIGNEAMPLAKVAINYTPERYLVFSTELPVGTKAHLAYSKPEYLLKETLASANGMRKFGAEAIMLFACMNRRVFMGNELADREFEYYKEANPNRNWFYGVGEIYQTKDGGGVLNSSLIAVGFREGSNTVPSTCEPIVDPKPVKDENSEIPLSDRLVTFLEATSDELKGYIRQLSNLAEHDQLTSLYNRRKLDEILLYELGKRHKDDELSVLMYDIDLFKSINDTYGHSEGDHVLVELSKIISESIRSCDVLGRWGGEEFVCVLTNTPLRGAQILAERIRARVEAANFSPVPKVTISVGVTAAKVNETLESLFIRLDKALYDAKNSGRNCVRFR